MSEEASNGPSEAGERDVVEETRSLFRSIALERQGYYDSSPGGRPRLSIWHRRLRRMVERVLDDRLQREPALRRLLDAGCGRGDFTLDLAARYPGLEELLGCDFAPEVIDLARSAAAEQPRARFSVGELDGLPFERSRVDATVCINVLHHLPLERQTAALGELARVTRHTLILEIKNALSPYFRIHSKRTEGVPIFPTSVDQVRDRLRPHGFELVARRGIFVLEWISPLVVLHFERAGSAERHTLETQSGSSPPPS